MTRKLKTPRIGPQMYRAAAYVALHPGCAILPVARAIKPLSVTALGYEAVHRAIKAGLIRAERKTRRGPYALYTNPEVL